MMPPSRWDSGRVTGQGGLLWSAGSRGQNIVLSKFICCLRYTKMPLGETSEAINA